MEQASYNRVLRTQLAVQSLLIIAHLGVAVCPAGVGMEVASRIPSASAARRGDALMFGPADNRITPDDRARAYELLGFGVRDGTRLIPTTLDLSAVLDTAALTELHARAREESHGRPGLRGLTEYRVGVELARGPTALRLTEVKRGGPNHAGRETDRVRTIIGTIHTHPWDAAQSIADVRNLLRTNDVLGGVVTSAGRVSLLVKDPEQADRDRSAFGTEVTLQGASFGVTPAVFRRLGMLGALSASFDLPIKSTRDPYIKAVCGRLGLLCYAGDVGGPPLRRD